MDYIYLDNAASTRIDDKVLETMLPYMKKVYGNPSSIHQLGREAKSLLERARKIIAMLLHAQPKEIIFTSGGTEANNLAIQSILNHLLIKNIITSPLEHQAVLKPIESIANLKKIPLHFLKITEKGHICYEHLEFLLKRYPNSFVSLMHANNEIGNLTDFNKVERLCKQFKAIFHSDAVQTIGKYHYNLQESSVDILTASAHKFHGPKGVGFMYIRNNLVKKPLLYGGLQEFGLRGGTENTSAIIGLAKALEIAYENFLEKKLFIQSLKNEMIYLFQKKFSNKIYFNGDVRPEKSLYTILNVVFKENVYTELLVQHLDLEKIAVSAGSACSSGTLNQSTGMNQLKKNSRDVAIRFSFSKYTTMEEIKYTVKKMKEILKI